MLGYEEPLKRRPIVRMESGVDEWWRTWEEDYERHHNYHGRRETRKATSVQANEEETMQQKNMFYTRFLVQEKVCIVKIDCDIGTNIASTTMVEKLGLSTVAHPRPYKMQGIVDCEEVMVTRRVSVSFRIGRYEDKILCDVVPIHTCHLLLGGPWRHNRRAKHNSCTNKYSLVHNRIRVNLCPMTSEQVHDDLMYLQKDRDQMQEEKKDRQKETVQMIDSEKRKFEKNEREKKRENENKREKNKREGEHKEEREEICDYEKESELKSELYFEKPMTVHSYKTALLNTNTNDSSLSSYVLSLVQVVDEIPRTIIPYRSADSIPEETTELPRRVGELVKVGIMREDMSSCANYEIIVPKKNETTNLFIDFELVNKYRYSFLYLDNMFDKLHSSYVLSTCDNNHVMTMPNQFSMRDCDK